MKPETKKAIEAAANRYAESYYDNDESTQGAIAIAAFIAGSEYAYALGRRDGIRKIIEALRREATLFGTGTAHNARDIADWLESKFAADLAKEETLIHIAKNLTGESCPRCHSQSFAVARDMIGTRHCGCGATWLPKEETRE